MQPLGLVWVVVGVVVAFVAGSAWRRTRRAFADAKVARTGVTLMRTARNKTLRGFVGGVGLLVVFGVATLALVGRPTAPASGDAPATAPTVRPSTASPARPAPAPAAKARPRVSLTCRPWDHTGMGDLPPCPRASDAR